MDTQEFIRQGGIIVRMVHVHLDRSAGRTWLASVLAGLERLLYQLQSAVDPRALARQLRMFEADIREGTPLTWLFALIT